MHSFKMIGKIIHVDLYTKEWGNINIPKYQIGKVSFLPFSPVGWHFLITGIFVDLKSVTVYIELMCNVVVVLVDCATWDESNCIETLNKLSGTEYKVDLTKGLLNRTNTGQGCWLTFTCGFTYEKGNSVQNLCLS